MILYTGEFRTIAFIGHNNRVRAFIDEVQLRVF